jgi:medium-chain acyl-[acyl-carrier-protein] hydrolase
MTRADILAGLHDYIAGEVLEGEDVGLEPSTPLLQLGVLNSMEMMRLVAHIEESYGVTVPMGKIQADTFQDLNAITCMVAELLELEA